LVLQAASNGHLNNGSAQVFSVEDNNGDFHIVRLTKIEAGNVNGVSEQVKDSTRRLLTQRDGDSMLQSYVQSLNKSLAPEINNDLL
jgi:hypothetical protein